MKDGTPCAYRYTDPSTLSSHRQGVHGHKPAPRFKNPAPRKSEKGRARRSMGVKRKRRTEPPSEPEKSEVAVDREASRRSARLRTRTHQAKPSHLLAVPHVPVFAVTVDPPLTAAEGLPATPRGEPEAGLTGPKKVRVRQSVEEPILYADEVHAVRAAISPHLSSAALPLNNETSPHVEEVAIPNATGPLNGIPRLTDIVAREDADGTIIERTKSLLRSWCWPMVYSSVLWPAPEVTQECTLQPVSDWTSDTSESRCQSHILQPLNGPTILSSASSLPPRLRKRGGRGRYEGGGLTGFKRGRVDGFKA